MGQLMMSEGGGTSSSTDTHQWHFQADYDNDGGLKQIQDILKNYQSIEMIDTKLKAVDKLLSAKCSNNVLNH